MISFPLLPANTHTRELSVCRWVQDIAALSSDCPRGPAGRGGDSRVTTAVLQVRERNEIFCKVRSNLLVRERSLLPPGGHVVELHQRPILFSNASKDVLFQPSRCPAAGLTLQGRGSQLRRFPIPSTSGTLVMSREIFGCHISR